VPTEAELKAAAKEAEAAEKQRFDDWKKLQEDAGHTVDGDSFQNATVSTLPEGPTIDLEVSS
jgi:hypothetical protein